MSIPALPPSTDLAGKSVLITGATAGLGFASALLFLQLGASPVHLAVRNLPKGRAAREKLLSDPVVKQRNPKAEVTVYEMDMASYESVIAFAAKFKSEQNQRGLNIAILNAGIIELNWVVSSSGNELNLQVHHLSTALLSLLLLPSLEATSTPASPSRLTIITSGFHSQAALKACPLPSFNYLDELNDASKFISMQRYAITKLLMIFFLRELASRVPAERVIMNTVCPGVVRTNIAAGMPFYLRAVGWAMQGLLGNYADVGARTYVHAVSVVGRESHGLWYQRSKETPYSGFVLSPEGEQMQKKIWTETMEKLEKASPGIGSGL